MTTERQQKIQALRTKLSSLTDAQKEKLISQGLVATVEGRLLSHHNTLLVYLQSPGTIPTVVAGFKQWKAAGRIVSKGQHGLMVWFPCGTKNQETGDVEEPEYFNAGYVFDISQTEPIEKEEGVTK